MTALYEIADEYNHALLAMAEMDDLPEEVINDTLEAIEGSLKDKAIAVAGFFRNIETDIDAMKEAEKSIKERRLAKEKQVAWMKDYLLRNMERTGITSIECPQFKISLRNNPESVQIVDESLIPTQFLTEVVEIKVDKKAIKEAGGCPGVELVRNKSVQIK